MDISEELEDEAGKRNEFELALIRKQRDAAKAEAALLAERIDQLERSLDFVESATGAALDPPAWMKPTASWR